MIRISRLGLLLGLSLELVALHAWAGQAQPVPIPEDPSIAPQVEIDAVGIGTVGYGKNAGGTSGAQGGVNFSDSALLIGGAQKLYNGAGVGSLGFGTLTTDETNTGVGNGVSPFVYQAFADVQSESFEALVGRSDNPTAHLVDFPTLRGDDLITLTNPLDPFSNGANVEEHRYSNVASVTINQGFAYFENFHVQHLINSAGNGPESGINSYGATFEYSSAPGLEAFARFPFLGVGYERISSVSSAPGGLHQIYAGGVVNLNESVIHRWDLRFQDIVSVGSDLKDFRNVNDTYQANSNTATAAIRYLYSPFGRPGYQVSLTGGYKNYLDVDSSRSLGFALTAVKRLGQGFDLVGQYQGQWREPALAAAQSNGVAFEQVAEVGLVLNLNATINQHIAPRRTLLNQQHQYIPD